MVLWTFYCYVSEAGNHAIDDWYQDLSPTAQAEFDTALDYLRQQPITGWRRPYAAPLGGGDCAGLCEIRFRSGGVQYRPLGEFGPHRLCFTILFPAEERDDQFVPRDACKQARRRADAIKQMSATVEECFNDI